MKKTLIITAALGMASVASANVDFYWDGSVGNDWRTAHNWHTSSEGDVQWVPTVNDCDVYIGVGSVASDKNDHSSKVQNGHVTVSGALTTASITINGASSSLTATLSGGDDFSTGSITLTNGAKMTLSGMGDLFCSDITIGTGSSLTFNGGENAIGGLDATTSMDLTGAITKDTTSLFSITGGQFWGGADKKIVLTGTLDLSALPNSRGQVTLIDISTKTFKDAWGYNVTTGLTVDYSGLTLTGAAYGPATLAWVGTEGGNGKLVLSYVPEPTTATLSLLALAGLAARRRRK